MNILDKFHSLVNSPHRFAQDWKARTGGKVLGYLCTNLPEELLYAAGVLPVRLLGTNESENVTRPYIFQAAFCAFSRDCFAQALLGRYDYVDGVMYGLCCMHARQVYQGWEKYRPISYSYELRLPTGLRGQGAKKYIMRELEDCKHSLEKWTGQPISWEALDRAIDLYNTNRRLMLGIYDLMKANDPPFTGAEVAEMALAGMLIDKETHNRLLEEVLKELSQRKNARGDGIRLMLLGSVNNDIEFIKLIESLGTRVVVDDYCTGRRYYQGEVIPEENRLAALASRLIEKPPCPLKDVPERRRPQYLSKLIDDYKVKGAIYTMQRYCDSHGLDYPVIESLMKGKGIPMLKLELDYSVPIGQIQTRIEAFLEMLKTL